MLALANRASLVDIGVAASLVASGVADAVVWSDSTDELGTETASLVTQTAPRSVVIVGGTAVVGEAVIEELKQLVPQVDIERLAGSDRVATAALAAQRSFRADEQDLTVAIANGRSLADAGAAAALVAAGAADLLLYAESADALGTATLSQLQDSDVSLVYLVGGETVLSQELRRVAAGAAGDARTRRLSGATRVHTAAQVARAAAGGGAAGDCVAAAVLANGWQASDVGAAAGLAAAWEHSVVLYTTGPAELGEPAREAIADLAPQRLVLVGSAENLSDELRGELPAGAAAVRAADAIDAARLSLEGSGQDCGSSEEDDEGEGGDDDGSDGSDGNDGSEEAGESERESTEEVSEEIIELTRWIEENVIEVYAGEHPWLHASWYEIPVAIRIHPAGQIDDGHRSAGLYGTTSAGPTVSLAETHVHSEHIILHELAHHYTLHRSMQEDDPDARLGIMALWLFMKDREQALGDRSPYRDRHTFGESIADYLAHFTISGCDGLPRVVGFPQFDRPAGCAFMTSLQHGELPQWFLDKYSTHGTYASIDIQKLWYDLKRLNTHIFLVLSIVHMVKGLFGGYCSNAEALVAMGHFSLENGNRELKNAWVDGGCVNRRPQELAASPRGSGGINVSWDAPLAQRTPLIDAYIVQWKTAGQAYDTRRQAKIDVKVGYFGRTSHTITGLARGTEHTIRVAGVNSANTADFADGDGHARTAETTAAAG